jgi:ribosome-binding protein aMBF1 (putative translation factor)
MKHYKDLRSELLEDRQVQAEYEKLGPQFDVISQLIEARHKSGLSQKDLASKIGTKQSAISRLEAGNTNPSLGLLEKISKALNTRFVIQIG